MAEHKHAAVLRAIADGKAVEYRPGNKWEEPMAVNPITHPNYEWRIKPEPKPDVVRYINAYLWEGHLSIEAAKKAQCEDIAGRVKLVIDGETGKLKSAEMLP